MPITAHNWGPMSRLDSFIRRLQAQRACLDWAAAKLQHLPGHVLELGLGNGRTYDHLRERLAGRSIFVFDRQVAAHPDCIPSDERLFLGDFGDTLPQAIARLGRRSVALIHFDLGSGEDAASRALARRILPLLCELMKPGALLIGDQPMELADLASVPLPEGVFPERYFMFMYNPA